MRRIAALVLALACAPGCVPAGTVVDLPAAGVSWVLHRGLAEHPALAFTVPSGPCEGAATRLVADLNARGELAAALDPLAEDEDAVRVLAGASGDPALEPLARALGLELVPGGFHLLGRDYTKRGDAVVAVLEDPERAGRPLCLFLGNDLEALAVYMDELPRLSRPWLRAYADGELALECPLALDGTPRAEEARDYGGRREAYFAGSRPLDLAGITFHARRSPGRARLQAYVKSLVSARGRVEGWFGARELPGAELFLYEHIEDFEHCLGTGALSVANRLRPRVHVLLAPGVPDDGGSGLARVLARHAAGEAAEPWLADGLAVAASGRWWNRPLEDWLRHLGRGALLPPIDAVLAADSGSRWSEHVLQPARALVLTRALAAGGRDPRRALALG
jgi:hypothetical protein